MTNNGTLDLQAGADIIGSGVLTNTTTGTLTKTTTTTQSDVTTTVENDGVVSSAVGTLGINGGGTPGESAGSFSASARGHDADRRARAGRRGAAARTHGGRLGPGHDRRQRGQRPRRSDP